MFSKILPLTGIKSTAHYTQVHIIIEALHTFFQIKGMGLGWMDACIT